MADIYAESKGRLHWAVVPPLSNVERTLEHMEFGRKHGAVSVFFRGRGRVAAHRHRRSRARRAADDQHEDPWQADAVVVTILRFRVRK